MADRAHVACGACRACCRGEAILLFPGDNAASYSTRTIVNPVNGMLAQALQQKPNGDCIYLTEAGCSIHERAPAICRSFDCAVLYLKIMSFPSSDRRRLRDLIESDVMRAGKERVRR